MTILPRIAKNPELADIQYVSNYVGELRGITGYYLPYIPEVYADIPTAEDFYHIIENDEEIYCGIEAISLAVAGEYYEVKCNDPVIKNILELSLKEIKEFTHARKSLAHKGLLYGLSIQRKCYEEIELEGYPGMTWVIPTELKEVDRRRVRIEKDYSDNKRQYWTLWSPIYDNYIVIEDRAKVPAIVDGAGVQDYIWWFNEHEETSPYGIGMGCVLYPLAYLRSRLKQYWADLSESWSKPTWLWFVDIAKSSLNAAANLGEGFTDTDSRVQALLDTAEGMRARHSAIIDHEDKLDIKEAGGTGNNIIKEFLEYLDAKIIKVIRGADVEASDGGGSYAKASVVQKNEDKKVNYIQQRLQEKLARDLLWDVLYRNRFNLVRLGKKLPRPSAISIEIGSKNEDMKEHVLMNAGERNIGQLAKQI